MLNSPEIKYNYSINNNRVIVNQKCYMKNLIIYQSILWNWQVQWMFGMTL